MLYKRGQVYWYRFRFAGRLFQESAKTTSKSLARQVERKRHQQLEQAVHGISKKVAPVTFGVAADAWLKLKQPSWAAKTYEVEERNLRHLKPVFGSLLLIDITAQDISDFQRVRLKAGAAAKTINLEAGTLRAILRRHKIWSNLEPDVTMLTVNNEIGKSLTGDEEARLLSACRASRSRTLLPFVTIAMHTGLRKGEVLSLRWQQVDFLNQEVTVGRSKTAAGSNRVIPLNERAFQTFKSWAGNFPHRQPDDAVFPSEAYGLAGNKRKPHTRTIDPTVPVGDIKHSWATAKRAAGIKCRFHDLRHTAATRLLERGASLAVVASILGWSPSTVAIMSQRYGHIGAERRKVALDTLVEPTEVSRRDDALSLASRN
jgi:integrase